MSDPRPMIIFDCDGTLVDSAHLIVAAMTRAFANMSVEAPPPERIRRVVGLSLDRAVARLVPGARAELIDAVAVEYRNAFLALRDDGEDANEALFPGVVDTLEAFRKAGRLMGVATGKGQRGLRKTLDRHGLAKYFVTLQTADQHPSKPHPAMVEAALAEAGASAGEAVLIGDTTYDMMMARTAGVVPVGVSWGYHEADELIEAGAHSVLESFAEAPAAVNAACARSVV